MKARSGIEVLEAYSDESGNSGSNLFDEAQPWFWTGTLIAAPNIDRVGSSAVGALCGRLGVAELHGKDLGLGRIEAIADDLREAFERVRARFVSRRQIATRHASAETSRLMQRPPC